MSLWNTILNEARYAAGQIGQGTFPYDPRNRRSSPGGTNRGGARGFNPGQPVRGSGRSASQGENRRRSGTGFNPQRPAPGTTVRPAAPTPNILQGVQQGLSNVGSRIGSQTQQLVRGAGQGLGQVGNTIYNAAAGPFSPYSRAASAGGPAQMQQIVSAARKAAVPIGNALGRTTAVLGGVPAAIVGSPALAAGAIFGGVLGAAGLYYGTRQSGAERSRNNPPAPGLVAVDGTGKILGITTGDFEPFSTDPKLIPVKKGDVFYDRNNREAGRIVDPNSNQVEYFSRSSTSVPQQQPTPAVDQVANIRRDFRRPEDSSPRPAPPTRESSFAPVLQRSKSLDPQSSPTGFNLNAKTGLLSPTSFDPSQAVKAVRAADVFRNPPPSEKEINDGFAPASPTVLNPAGLPVGTLLPPSSSSPFSPSSFPAPASGSLNTTPLPPSPITNPAFNDDLKAQLINSITAPQAVTVGSESIPVSLQDYYAVQRQTGAEQVDQIVNALNYNQTNRPDLAAWARNNPLLAQRELNKLLARENVMAVPTDQP